MLPCFESLDDIFGVRVVPGGDGIVGMTMWLIVLLLSAILVTGVVMIRRDRLRKSLEITREQFRILYERAPVGYHSLDENGCLLIVNQAWLKMLGYARDEVIGKSFGDFMTAESRSQFHQRFANFKASGIAKSVDFELVCKDGSIIPGLIDGWGDYDSKGNYIRSHCMVFMFKNSNQRLHCGPAYFAQRLCCFYAGTGPLPSPKKSCIIP